MNHVAEFTDRTITVGTDNPCHAAILEGWPHWKHMHRHADIGPVTMHVDPVTRVLVFTVAAEGTADLGDPILDYYDTLMACGRAWQDTYTFSEAGERVGGLDVTLSRNSRCRRESAHYTHADLKFKTPHGVTEFPGLRVADLRTLGEFLTGYADAMEDDYRDDLA